MINSTINDSGMPICNEHYNKIAFILKTNKELYFRNKLGQIQKL